MFQFSGDTQSLPPDDARPRKTKRNAEPRPRTKPSQAEQAAHLRVLGLEPGAKWAAIERAYQQLVADLTPGPSASHRNVELAESMLAEVETAYRSLRLHSV